MALFLFTPNTVIQSSKVNANLQNLEDHGLHINLKWTFSGTLTTQTSTDYISFPDNVTISRVDLIVSTAPTGAEIIVDIERSTDSGANWVTIFTNTANRPQIAAAAKTGNTTTIDIPSGTGLTHLYRAKISQVGSTIAGADLSVIVRATADLD